MPWNGTDASSARKQFVLRADAGTEHFSSVCASTGISRPTGYLWLKRYRLNRSLDGLTELSRRPYSMPTRTTSDIEYEVLRLRDQVGWSGARVSKALEARGVFVAPSTVCRIVRRRKGQNPRECLSSSWAVQLLLAKDPSQALKHDLPDGMDSSRLGAMIKTGISLERRKALAVIAYLRDIPTQVTAELLQMTTRAVRNCARLYSTGRVALLATRKRHRRVDDERDKQLVFQILHAPPASYRLNRTTWKLGDLHRVLAQAGHRMSRPRIRVFIKSAGFRWRKARTVLTSKDPEYVAKVEVIKQILSTLEKDEAFFSVDEFGPFTINKKGGRKRIGPKEDYVVPQWQRSKGWTILTAALELSRNRLSHFYSLKKNTGEMIKMAELLRMEYRSCKTLYLSWDAASWHISKELNAHLDRLNQSAETDGFPVIKTAQLPSGAQFLDVIESVFSGMARAIVHNSDYPDLDSAKYSIDRYFAERNDHFRNNPRRAGSKIWGAERVPCEFSDSHNCKDPRY